MKRDLLGFVADVRAKTLGAKVVQAKGYEGNAARAKALGAKEVQAKGYEENVVRAKGYVHFAKSHVPCAESRSQHFVAIKFAFKVHFERKPPGRKVFKAKAPSQAGSPGVSVRPRGKSGSSQRVRGKRYLVQRSLGKKGSSQRVRGKCCAGQRVRAFCKKPRTLGTKLSELLAPVIRGSL